MKKILECVLTAVLFLSVGTNVYAEGEEISSDSSTSTSETTELQSSDNDQSTATVVATVNGTEYETVQEAINNNDNVTIQVVSNTTEDITIPSGKNITLNIATDVTITNSTSHTITNNGTLVVAGNGTVDNVSHGKGAVYNNVGGVATLEGAVTFTRSQETGIDKDNSGGNSWYTIKNFGTMYIGGNVIINQGATGHDGYSSLIGNGWQSYSEAPGNGEPDTSSKPVAMLTITGGTISGGLNTIKNDDSGYLNITGGSLTNTHQHVIMNWNEATISSGTFVNAGDTMDVIYTGNHSDESINQGKTTITGGTFTAGSNGVIFQNVDNTSLLTVQGGTYSVDVVDYLPEGYQTVISEGKYVVQQQTAVAKIGDTPYASLQDAIDAAGETETTITLVDDVTDITALNIASGKNIVLDLNGKTISTKIVGTHYKYDKHDYAINNSGTLKINDSSTEGTGKISSRGLDNYGTLIINGGTYEASDSGGGACVWNEDTGTLIINGGTFKVVNGLESGANSGNNDAVSIYNDSGKVTVTKGVFNSNGNVSYCIISQGGEFTVTPEKNEDVIVHGTKGAFGINGGTAVINGGTYTEPNYYALYVSNDRGTAKVTVNDGIFYGNERSVHLGSDDGDTCDSTIEINGGTFIKPIYAEEKTIDNALVVKGGTFANNVSEYLASGYNLAKIDKNYVVIKKGLNAPVTEAITPAVDENAFDEVSSVITGEDENTTVTSVKLEASEISTSDLDKEETKKVEDEVVKSISKAESAEILLPLNLNLKATKKTTTSAGTKVDEVIVTELENSITATIYLNDATLAKLEGKTIKVVRVHTADDGETEYTVLDATLSGNALTFVTDKFSNYYVVTYSAEKIVFIDVDDETFHKEDIDWLADAGITKGWLNEDGTREFRPMNAIARADMAAFLQRLAVELGYSDAGSFTPTDDDWAIFTDVAVDEIDYHQKDILWLANARITKGWVEADGTTTFRPFNDIARADMAAFLRRLAAKYNIGDAATWKPTAEDWAKFPDVAVDKIDYHQEDILWLAHVGITKGFEDGTFRPFDTVKRCDMAAFIHRFANYAKEQAD